ncbi:MAG: glycosyltransferase [Cyclobacteriaceae bacterium]|nr:glycosyltransferase [Cyclobacteriaceae bacterium]
MSELSALLGVSIVICTYNGKHRLEKTLTYALRQSISFPYEVLVVDNASVDGTAEWVLDFKRQHDNKSIIRIVSEKKPGLSSARMRGIKEARYSLILFCDDDNWLASDYLEIGKRRFEELPELGALGGEGIPVFESQKPDWFDQFSHSYAVGDLGRKSGILPKGSAVYGAGCFFRKSVVNELLKKGWESILSDRKGDSLNSGGDVELCYAIQLLGYSVGFERKLKFHHFLEDRRLKWEYYLNLKKGISKSFPILESYHINDYQQLYDFKKYLLSSFKVLLKGLIKTSILSQNTYQRKVDKVVVKTKFWSFLTNYRTAIDGFKRNQKIFGT